LVAKVGGTAVANNELIDWDAVALGVGVLVEALLALWGKDDISPESLDLAGGWVIRMVW